MYNYDKLYENKGYLYAYNVVENLLTVDLHGEIIPYEAPKYVKLQCEQFFSDLEESQKDDFPFYFDIKQMTVIENLLKIINLADGLQRGKPCYQALFGFQWFILINLFCWRYKSNSDKRRYESCLISLARKNGKTALVALIMLILMITEENYSQFYSVAPNREISQIIKEEMNKFIESSPLIQKHFTNIRTELRCDVTKSTMKPLAYSENKLDSRQVSSFCADEIGAMPNNYGVEAMFSGMQNVTSKLGFLISTAYDTETNPFEDYISYSKRILDGQNDSKIHFSLMYRPNDEYLNDYLDENCIFQSNPLACELSLNGIYDNIDFLYKKRQESIDIPSTVGNYKTKLLNIPINSAIGETYLSLDELRPCMIEDYNWQGREVYLGIDLAFSQDNCGLAMLTYDNELRKYIAQIFCFIPSDSLEKKIKAERVDYRRYCENEWCYAIGDRIVDYAWIEEFIVKVLKEKFGVKVMAISFDKYNATATIHNIEAKTDIECVEIPQTFMVLSPAIKKLKDSILTYEFAYVENELFELNCCNAVVVSNPSGSLYRVSKKSSNFKIDMLASLLNAFVTIDSFEVKKSVYESQGIDYYDNLWDF